MGQVTFSKSIGFGYRFSKIRVQFQYDLQHDIIYDHMHQNRWNMNHMNSRENNNNNYEFQRDFTTKKIILGLFTIVLHIIDRNV